ncbi:hypothetical protein N9C31_00775 [Gammaproteobacteria bacterium]|nr:hypothetical protein [Gammaproteobacteria bacterium]
MSDKKKSLGEQLDTILPPEKVDEYVGKAKKLFSNLMNRAKKTEATQEKPAEKKAPSEKASKKDEPKPVDKE